MPVFRYKAVTAAGETSEGVLSAAGRQEVMDILRQRQVHPVSLTEEQSKNVKIKIRKSVNARELSLFCRQFHSMLNAGINILSCLDILRVQIQNKRLRTAIEDVYENVQKGLTLSEAMRRNDKIFPELFLSMVGAGEVSGNLDHIMKRMSIHYEKEFKLANKIKSALVYPAVLMVVAIAVIAFMLTFVMPTFISLFSTSGTELPIPTRIIIGISAFMKERWYIILLALVLLAYVIRRYVQTASGRRQIDKLALKLPLVKGLTERTIAARFARTMSTMMASGIPLLQSLESVSGVVNNTLFKEAIENIYNSVRKGQTLAEPVRLSGLFPPMITNMIKIGEESGTMDELLDKSADFFDEEVEISVQRFTTLFEPMMIVVMGLIIGSIVISMLLPMFDMFKTIK